MMTPAQAALECVEAMESLYAKEPQAHKDGILIRSKRLDDAVTIWQEPDRTVIAFAGSRNWLQWIDGDGGNIDYGWKRVDGVRVHEGAYEAVKDLTPMIHDALFGFIGPLHVCYHSRGGLLGPEWVRRDGSSHDVKWMTSLGSPRPGDAGFCELVRLKCADDCQIVRVTNNNDLVPFVPPYIKGYRHLGEWWHIDRRGRGRKGGLGFFAQRADKIIGRWSAMFHGVVMDSKADHVIPTGYGPAVRAWHASESAAPVDGGKTEGGA
jgi:hypothetical protein